MTRAGELLNRIRAEGAAEIRRMIDDSHSEDLFIDYKQSNTAFPSRSLDRFDRKNLAKSLSGFGNGDGGIVIWGVVCKSGENGDLPSEEKLLKDANAFKSLLDGEYSGLTSPPHNQAESVAILADGGPAGFVVTYVPPGFDVPFHSNHPEAQGYFMRAGSSFSKITPSILAGMFGRKPNAEISLSARPRYHFLPGTEYTRISFGITARNVGRGIGRELYLRIDAEDRGETFYDLSINEGWYHLPTSDNRWVLFSINKIIVLPQGVQIKLFEISYMSKHGKEKDLEINVSAGVDGGLGDDLRMKLDSDVLFDIGYGWNNRENRDKLAGLTKYCDSMIEQELRRLGSTAISLPSLTPHVE
jgi:hypothetical protein